jgi:hypothetical protein
LPAVTKPITAEHAEIAEKQTGGLVLLVSALSAWSGVKICRVEMLPFIFWGGFP